MMCNHLIDEELKQIQSRCDAATPGPWFSYNEGRDHTSGSSFITTGEKNVRGNDIELSGASSADQDFIAHARQDIPILLNEIKRFKAKSTHQGNVITSDGNDNAINLGSASDYVSSGKSGR